MADSGLPVGLIPSVLTAALGVLGLYVSQQNQRRKERLAEQSRIDQAARDQTMALTAFGTQLRTELYTQLQGQTAEIGHLREQVRQLDREAEERSRSFTTLFTQNARLELQYAEVCEERAHLAQENTRQAAEIEATRAEVTVNRQALERATARVTDLEGELVDLRRRMQRQEDAPA